MNISQINDDFHRAIGRAYIARYDAELAGQDPNEANRIYEESVQAAHIAYVVAYAIYHKSLRFYRDKE